MRGKVLAVRKLLLLPVLALTALAAGAMSPALAASETAVVVLDASKNLDGKIGGKSKLDIVRAALQKTVAAQGDTRAMGLVAYGNDESAGCANIEALAEPGSLKGANTASLLGSITPKGSAPIASAVGAAAMLGGSGNRVNVVLIAAGGDSCKADPCDAAKALKERQTGIRIHVIGLSDKPDSIQPLACMANTTGGKFIAATNEPGFDIALGAVFAEIDKPQPTAAPPASTASNTSAPAQSAAGTSSDLNLENTDEEVIAVMPPAPVPTPPAEPVAVRFYALATEGGPKLQSGLIWRVYDAKSKKDGGFKLLSTFREAAPSTQLLPGEYLVNAAYGLSNLTRKIKVEAGKSPKESFVLNTGGLSLKAVLTNGEECPEGEVDFEIQTDEQDQYGKRETILANATPDKVIRLNAGAYHIKSLYGDANANVGASITVEPGKITQATLKHTGAKITFRLVQSRGGEALTDTQWKILTSAGDEVKSVVGALPTHVLAAGNYAVVAEHGKKAYSRKFSVEPGSDKQIEVAIADGAISEEELQALLDPPEAPRPGTGGLVGQGPGGFDGFTKPADPNAPLLNPGALLRPTR